jgi:hypothetical protein
MGKHQLKFVSIPVITPQVIHTKTWRKLIKLSIKIVSIQVVLPQVIHMKTLRRLKKLSMTIDEISFWDHWWIRSLYGTCHQLKM